MSLDEVREAEFGFKVAFEMSDTARARSGLESPPIGDEREGEAGLMAGGRHVWKQLKRDLWEARETGSDREQAGNLRKGGSLRARHGKWGLCTEREQIEVWQCGVQISKTIRVECDASNGLVSRCKVGYNFDIFQNIICRSRIK